MEAGHVLVAAGFGKKGRIKPLLYASFVNLEKPCVTAAICAFKGYFGEMMANQVVLDKDGCSYKITMVN